LQIEDKKTGFVQRLP